ncbi:DMT family transporter [Candidatus Haliotispira prima]|uniref:DMT family transporter n=1 Tax=Candidatus Haliotispira prima TaxID=3034016 RepID=A0ABY8MGB4_9SPIO|nr:DMT family transporter [Candidatus Haliotispira prima]
MTYNLKKAGMYALIAAALNGTIGTLTRLGFTMEATHHQIAFYKCFLSFLLLLIFCICHSGYRKKLFLLRQKFWHFSLQALLGIFGLYFFETWAFSKISIPLVSFLTYSASIITLVLSVVFLKEKFKIHTVLSFLLIIAGIYLMFYSEIGVSGNTGSIFGMVLAILGGTSYALFIFVSKLLRIGSGIPHLVWMLGLGSLYLLFPVLYESSPTNFAWPGISAVLVIVSLALFPTIGGFYCTTRAIDLGQAGRVQIIETSDPLFATFYGFLIFGDKLSLMGSLSAALIMLGLVFAMR